MQKLIHKSTLIWKLGFNRPICSACQSMAKPSKLEQDKWVCTGCNEIIEVE